MQFVFYAVIFLVTVMLIANFIQTVAFPPVSISLADIPATAQQELKTYFPSFKATEVKHIRPRHRYTLTGADDGVACRFQFDLTPDGELAELKFRKQSDTKLQMSNKRPVPTTAVPTRIADQMNAYLRRERADHSAATHSARAFAGMVGDENAFEIEFQLGDFEYDFVFTESGRMVTFKKENSDF